MSVRPYSPKGELASSTVGVVLYNQMGACELGDLGRDAQYMANALGVHVIAADRPGSGITHRGQGRRLAGDYVGALSRLAGKRIMPQVEALGLTQVVTAGRSAGGLAALGTVCTEQLPVVAVHAQEPVGWHVVDPAVGRQAHKEYNERQAILLGNDLHSVVRPEGTDQVGWRGWLRTALIVATAPTDIANNEGVWSQDLALTSAFTIAVRHPYVRADIIFAEHSLVVEPEEVDQFQRQLGAARGIHPNTAPFNVSTQPDTVHASFDLRRLSAHLVGNTVQSVLPPAA